jgi:hypothetical protein
MNGFPRSVRDVVAVRAGGRCERCALSFNSYQFHHRRPRGMGGSRDAVANRASNCLMLCRQCHAAVESKRELALELGFIVRQGQVPAEVPISRCGQWVLLADDGSIETVKRHD